MDGQTVAVTREMLGLVHDVLLKGSWPGELAPAVARSLAFVAAMLNASESQDGETEVGSGGDAPAPIKRGRGRPRKVPEAQQG